MTTHLEASPVQLSPVDEVVVVNSCLRVNGKPFIVESHEGQFFGVARGHLQMREAGVMKNIPLVEVSGSWA